MTTRLLTAVMCLWSSAALAQATRAPSDPPAPNATTPPLAPLPQEIAPPAVVSPPPQTEIPRTGAPAAPQEPLAGYSSGSFFLRDPHDWFVLFPKARLQVDGYSFLNRNDPPAGSAANSSSDPRPKDSIFVRRARVELMGTMLGHFDFHIAGEYATTPSSGQTGVVADAYMIVDYLPYLKLQGGQFDLPFTMENRTSDKYFDYMERSVVVRAFGAPTNKDQGAMVFGWLPKRIAYYSVGVFNGDGQNYKNQDNGAAVIGRAFVAPLAWMAGNRRWMEDIWVGGSFWWQRNTNTGGPVAPVVGGGAQNDLTAMTTQGGFGFFSTNYGNGKDANGNAITSHLVPTNDTVKWALEANVPVWSRVGLRFELVHQSVGLAQYNDANTSGATITRTRGSINGTLEGYGYYLEAYAWILGDVNYLETPGLETAPRLKKFATTSPPKWGLQVSAKYEHVGFNVSGLSSGATDSMGNVVKDPAEGNYSIHVFELGLNAWATKHVRLTANYVLNMIDGDSARVQKNFYVGRQEHELLARIGINL